MSVPWLHVVGIGEDGMDGLAPPAIAALKRAEVVIGGDRHHELSSAVRAERRSWPSPFDAMVREIRALRDRRPVVLVTGDPLWYSVGARLLRDIPADEIAFHPQLSAFQWAACRMGWSLADCETVTVHGRPASQIVPLFAPRRRLLALTQDRSTPRTIGRLLTERGYGDSALTVLAALGGPRECRTEGRARDWEADAPAFHTLAIECIADRGTAVLPRTGLPDHAFEHDGQMTKQDVRAGTLAKLVPFPGATLWDVGSGCGSIGIEWMRGASEARAIGIEPNAERRGIAMRNAEALGTPALRLVAGRAPAALEGLAAPDAIFIGGGLTTSGLFEACWAALRSGGRLVANAVTLESEARLAALHAEHGGALVRIGVAHAQAVGPYRGWHSSMPVTQWSVTR